MLKKFVTLFGGDPNKRVLSKSNEIVDQINALEPQFEELSSEALLGKTAEFRLRLAQGETLDDLLPEAFAAVREASKRTNARMAPWPQSTSAATTSRGSSCAPPVSW